MTRQKYLYTALAAILITCSSWGFYAHIRINRLAVFTLPKDIGKFYKTNIRYVSEHAVDADKRRYADTAEATRHYLDVELYETNIDSIPERWEDAIKKYGLKKLNESGTLPWQIYFTYHKLVKAFKERDSVKILIHSAYLGHYLADAHVPLHTTQNHNGQLTNQVGIHAFWESRLPELFAEEYDFIVGKATYIENPLKQAWKIIKNTHQKVDTVLLFEARLNEDFPAMQKYSFSSRNQQLGRHYSVAYSKAYHDLMENMVERQMRSSVYYIGCYWYSAWIDAGQPKL